MREFDLTVMVFTAAMMLGAALAAGMVVRECGLPEGLPSLAGSGLRTLTAYDIDADGHRVCRELIRVSNGRAFHATCP
jgi:hypothetical protein